MIERATLAAPAVCAGIGLHTGARVRMAMKPAPLGSGIVFERTDLDVSDRLVPARREFVRSTDLGTTLVNDAGASVATVEHLMAALAGLGVDDLIIELDGPEVPAMDGSSAPFVDLILHAGLKTRPATCHMSQCAFIAPSLSMSEALHCGQRMGHVDRYCSKVNAFLGKVLAWATMAVAACVRIWLRVKAEISSATSASRMADSEACKFSMALARLSVV